MGRSRGGSAPPLPEVGRGARGSAGRGGVGFQSAGDSGRGPGACPPWPLPSTAFVSCRKGERRPARSAPSPPRSCAARSLRGSADPGDGAKVGPASSCPGPSAPPARLTFSHSAPSYRRNEQCWSVLWLRWFCALLFAAVATRAETGKRPALRMEPAASAPWGSWFCRPARLRCAPHSWT